MSSANCDIVCSCRFDTVYLGKSIRVAKDIRGDTLVVERDGPPRSFGDVEQ